MELIAALMLAAAFAFTGFLQVLAEASQVAS